MVCGLYGTETGLDISAESQLPVNWVQESVAARGVKSSRD